MLRICWLLLLLLLALGSFQFICKAEEGAMVVILMVATLRASGSASSRGVSMSGQGLQPQQVPHTCCNPACPWQPRRLAFTATATFPTPPQKAPMTSQPYTCHLRMHQTTPQHGQV
jgi:hypothetical protein